MTTPYKQALEIFSSGGFTLCKEQYDSYKRIIRRALMLADAVYGEELSKCHPIRDRANGIYSSESHRVDGWNNCLEHLKKIGAGE